jgi:hypothetical protein
MSVLARKNGFCGRYLHLEHMFKSIFILALESLFALDLDHFSILDLKNLSDSLSMKYM